MSESGKRIGLIVTLIILVVVGASLGIYFAIRAARKNAVVPVPTAPAIPLPPPGGQEIPGGPIDSGEVELATSNVGLIVGVVVASVVVIVAIVIIAIVLSKREKAVVVKDVKVEKEFEVEVETTSITS